MGTLVFQATLGGAVNIIGPNIANTINFTLPSADGTSGQTWTTNGSGVLTFGTLGVAGGGTGQTTLATGALGYGQGTSAHASLAIGTAGQILTVNSGATAPQWSTLTGVAVTTFSAGTTGFTPSSATSGAVTLAGTLATTNGGTGLTAFTSNQVFYASSTSAFAQSANLTFNGTTLTANTIGAFTLGGTVSGGGNQINNVIIGTSTPLAGAFTSLTASTTLGVTGVSTLTGGAVVQGLTVGRGAGAVSTNTVLGNGAFTANSTGATNVSIGYLTSRDSTGSDNVNIGSFRGFTRTTGDGNTFVGTGTGAVIVGTGNNNSGVGMLSLVSLTSGYANSALGMGAGQNNQTGTCNVYIGDSAGFSSTGFSNTFVGGGNANGGYSSGGSVTSGVLNTFLGSASGRSVTTGSYNTIIGAFAGSTADTNRVVLSDGQGNAIIDSGNAKTIALQNASSASGTGITFPATQSASSNANTLDDYEEGTWTPTFTSTVAGTLVVSYTNQVGWYTKVGRQVTAGFNITFTLIKGTASGDILLAGFPFTPATISGDAQTGWFGFVSTAFPIVPLGILQNTGSATTYVGVSGGGTASISSFVDATNYSIRGTYSFIV